jgi:hydroxylamine reductase
MSQNQMFCYQCEQTAKGQGCTVMGVCGKTPEVATLQDLLVYKLRELSQLAILANNAGLRDEKTDAFTAEALFVTLTNVNFDPQAIVAYLRKAEQLQLQLQQKLHNKNPYLKLENTIEGMVEQGKQHGINSEPNMNADLHSLQWLLTFGLKGVAAYSYHAYLLGKKDSKVFDFIYEGLAAPLNKALGANEFVGLVFKCGEINIRAMELLDAGNTETYGHPTPTNVPLGHKKGKAILVSGHDLKDLENILKQTQDKNITVYTHGEMLPTHGYPALKKYPNFYGHYGTAWFNQQKEFAQFPGAILMTTNCIQKPMESYSSNIFTTGPVGFLGVKHVEGPDFSPVIQKALELPGFQEDAAGKTVLVGFGRNAVLSVAGKVIDSVKAGHIKRFILVG